MPTYASTFISGMQDVVERALRDALPGLQLRRIDDGIVLYDAATPPDAIARLRFLNNTFAVITLCEKLPVDPLKSLVKAVREDNQLAPSLAHILGRKRTYMLRASVENQPVHLPPIQRQKLERALAGVELQGPPLRPEKQHAQADLWLVVRREGYGFFGLRLADVRSGKSGGEQSNRPLAKGELRPELAHLLCLLSEPKPTDHFLDPFAGHGAIPLERVRMGHVEEIVALDSDPALVRAIAARAQEEKVRVTAKVADALHLRFPDHHFTTIVTDPPWGIYGDAGSVGLDYGAMLRELCRVTRPGGSIVLLLARTIPLRKTLEAMRDRLELLEYHDILVSGQKAAVYRLKVAHRAPVVIER